MAIMSPKLGRNSDTQTLNYDDDNDEILWPRDGRQTKRDDDGPDGGWRHEKKLQYNALFTDRMPG